MKIIEHKAGGAIVGLSSDEIYVLSNALNEVCNGIDLPEFETRLGASKGAVRELLEDLLRSIEDL
ncbi:hypothetical protein [Rhizobium sp. Rhizsp82]|uniref:hypothetical protein n=1 Tax=Rhizobium sp. Rhizsp82 TaxID=3243057 RepID=UPI0039B5556F